MTAACSTPACERPTLTRGYCGTHYRYRLHTGRYGYRDAAPARAHVARLRRLGWTWEAIGTAAGVSPWVPLNLHRGRTRQLWPESEAALLSVPLRRCYSHRGVDPTGTRRRVQALALAGWPCAEVAARAGTTQRTLATVISRGGLSAALAARVARVYAELEHTPGPSRVAAGKARGLGFVPSSRWIPETIDNPNASPILPAWEAAS